MLFKHLVLIVVVAIFSVHKPVYAAKNECGLGLLAKPAEWASRGLKQKKVPNLMTDYYADEQLKVFREQEKTVADNTYASNRAISRSQIYPAPYTKKQLESIAQRLLKKWPHSNPDYRIIVTSSLFYGPLTSQDGAILIPVGFLERAKSEDEIAFILAHELSHLLLFAADAVKKTETIAKLRNINQSIGNTLSMSKNIQSANEENQTKNKEKKKKLDKIKNKSFAYYEHTRELVTEYIHPSWQKRQEDEADLLGAELLIKAGYSVEGIAQAFDNMEATESAVCRELKRFAANMQSFIDNELQVAADDMVEGKQYNVKDQFIQNAKKLSKKKIEKALQQQAMPKTHRPYDKRLKYVFKFIERSVLKSDFDAADDREPQEGILANIKASSEYKTLFVSAKALYETQLALEDNDLNKAAKSLSKANMQSQRARILKYRLRKQQNNYSAAIDNLSIALRSNEPALDVYHKSLAYRLGANQLNTADSLIRRAERQFNDKVHFLPERVYLAQRRTANKNGETHKLLDECLGAGRDGMEGPCYAAALGINADFREQHAEILMLVDCETNKDTGGDVVCGGDNPYKGKGFTVPKFSSLLKKD